MKNIYIFSPSRSPRDTSLNFSTLSSTFAVVQKHCRTYIFSRILKPDTLTDVFSLIQLGNFSYFRINIVWTPRIIWHFVFFVSNFFIDLVFLLSLNKITCRSWFFNGQLAILRRNYLRIDSVKDNPRQYFFMQAIKF